MWEITPAGEAEPYHAAAIWARSQPARTYLENHLQEILATTTMQELALHAIMALAASMPAERPLTASLVSLGVVGMEEESFCILKDAEVAALFAQYTNAETSMDIQ